MMEAQKVVELAESWLGRNEKDGTHKLIIDIYNSHRPLPRNLKMEYNWSWCAAFWSALAIKLGYTSIIPIEMSCGFLIEEAKKMGCWIEEDFHVPSIGDAVLYDWDDKEHQESDNRGWPEHIGVVTYINRDSGYFVVIEGNYSDSVKKRNMLINGRFIRGFIHPKYDTVTQKDYKLERGKPLKDIAQEVIIGIWDNGDVRKELLKSYGYDPDKVQKKVNEILIPKTIISESDPTKIAYAKKSDVDLKGSYKVLDNAYLRVDAGTNKLPVKVLNKGTIVNCYGFYSIQNGNPWYLVVSEEKHDVGFISSKLLKKL